jgi:hypothetical protein
MPTCLPLTLILILLADLSAEEGIASLLAPGKVLSLSKDAALQGKPK